MWPPPPGEWPPPPGMPPLGGAPGEWPPPPGMSPPGAAPGEWPPPPGMQTPNAGLPPPPPPPQLPLSGEWQQGHGGPPRGEWPAPPGYSGHGGGPPGKWPGTDGATHQGELHPLPDKSSKRRRKHRSRSGSSYSSSYSAEDRALRSQFTPHFTCREVKGVVSKDKAGPSHPSRKFAWNSLDCTASCRLLQQGRVLHHVELDSALFSGVRTKTGLRGGVYQWELDILAQPLATSKAPWAIRIGFGLPNSNLVLGVESKGSIGFCQNGVMFIDGTQQHANFRFGLSDTVGCCLDLKRRPARAELIVNGIIAHTIKLPSSYLAALESDKDLTQGFHPMVSFRGSGLTLQTHFGKSARDRALPIAHHSRSSVAEPSVPSDRNVNKDSRKDMETAFPDAPATRSASAGGMPRRSFLFEAAFPEQVPQTESEGRRCEAPFLDYISKEHISFPSHIVSIEGQGLLCQAAAEVTPDMAPEIVVPIALPSVPLDVAPAAMTSFVKQRQRDGVAHSDLGELLTQWRHASSGGGVAFVLGKIAGVKSAAESSGGQAELDFRSGLSPQMKTFIGLASGQRRHYALPVSSAETLATNLPAEYIGRFEGHRCIVVVIVSYAPPAFRSHLARRGSRICVRAQDAAEQLKALGLNALLKKDAELVVLDAGIPCPADANGGKATLSRPAKQFFGEKAHELLREMTAPFVPSPKNESPDRVEDSWLHSERQRLVKSVRADSHILQAKLQQIADGLGPESMTAQSRRLREDPAAKTVLLLQFQFLRIAHVHLLCSAVASGPFHLDLNTAVEFYKDCMGMPPQLDGLLGPRGRFVDLADLLSVVCIVVKKHGTLCPRFGVHRPVPSAKRIPSYTEAEWRARETLQEAPNKSSVTVQTLLLQLTDRFPAMTKQPEGYRYEQFLERVIQRVAEEASAPQPTPGFCAFQMFPEGVPSTKPLTEAQVADIATEVEGDGSLPLEELMYAPRLHPELEALTVCNYLLKAFHVGPMPDLPPPPPPPQLPPMGNSPSPGQLIPPRGGMPPQAFPAPPPGYVMERPEWHPPPPAQVPCVVAPPPRGNGPPGNFPPPGGPHPSYGFPPPPPPGHRAPFDARPSFPPPPGHEHHVPGLGPPPPGFAQPYPNHGPAPTAPPGFLPPPGVAPPPLGPGQPPPNHGSPGVPPPGFPPPPGHAPPGHWPHPDQRPPPPMNSAPPPGSFPPPPGFLAPPGNEPAPGYPPPPGFAGPPVQPFRGPHPSPDQSSPPWPPPPGFQIIRPPPANLPQPTDPKAVDEANAPAPTDAQQSDNALQEGEKKEGPRKARHRHRKKRSKSRSRKRQKARASASRSRDSRRRSTSPSKKRVLSN